MANVFQKKKSSFLLSNFIFEERLSSTGHLNVITLNINTYFIYQLAKTRVKN